MGPVDGLVEKYRGHIIKREGMLWYVVLDGFGDERGRFLSYEGAREYIDMRDERLPKVGDMVKINVDTFGWPVEVTDVDASGSVFVKVGLVATEYTR